MTWLETIKLFLIALAEVSKPLALYLKLKNARLLWDEQDKLNEKFEDNEKRVEELRNNRCGVDADKLRDDFVARQRFIDTLSAELSLSAKGSESANA